MMQPHGGGLVDRKLRQGETAGYCLNERRVGDSYLNKEVT
jgi:hypothetical protein